MAGRWGEWVALCSSFCSDLSLLRLCLEFTSPMSYLPSLDFEDVGRLQEIHNWIGSDRSRVSPWCYRERLTPSFLSFRNSDSLCRFWCCGGVSSGLIFVPLCETILVSPSVGTGFLYSLYFVVEGNYFLVWSWQLGSMESNIRLVAIVSRMA